MKENLSTIEKDFLLECIAKGLRVDSRGPHDYRKRKVTFGQDYGHVEVELGKSKVLAQVSCVVAAPMAERPSEGLLRYQVNLSPMAAERLDSLRHGDLGMELGRIVERVLKETRAVDLESLCIIPSQKVWSVRVDLHVLDFEGNIIDAASLAALAALLHFRRPHVTVIGDVATVHTLASHTPVALAVNHRPLCVTFAFFQDGDRMVVDPTYEEETLSLGRLTIAMNYHGELCAMHKYGAVALPSSQILLCTQIAYVKVKEISDFLISFLAQDEERRKTGGDPSTFAYSTTQKKIMQASQPSEMIRPPSPRDEYEVRSDVDEDEVAGEEMLDIDRKKKKKTSRVASHVALEAPQTASLFEGSSSSW